MVQTTPPGWLNVIATHADAFAWVLGATVMGCGLLFGLFLRRGGMNGIRKWILQVSDQERSKHTLHVVQGGHKLYTQQAARERRAGKNGAPPSPEIEAATGEWLYAVAEWLAQENRRRGLVFRARYSQIALWFHIVAGTSAVALFKFALQGTAWFKAAVGVAVVAGVGLLVLAVPLVVALSRHGAPAELKE